MFSSCARINTWSIVQFGVINIVSVQPSVVNANIRYNDKNGQLHFSGSSKYLMENISNDPLTLLYPNIPWSMGWWSCEPTIQYSYSLFTQIFLTQLFSTVFCLGMVEQREETWPGVTGVTPTMAEAGQVLINDIATNNISVAIS